MIISCPQCHTRYEIDAALIPLAGRRMRCAKCGEIWRAYPQELSNFVERTAQAAETTPPKPEKSSATAPRAAAFRFFKYLLIILLFLAMLAGIGATAISAAYNYRCQLAERFPSLEPLVKKISPQCPFLGQGFEFEDISFFEYDDPADQMHKMDVSGKISNCTKHSMNLPLLRIELLDSEGNILQKVNQALGIESIKAGSTYKFKTTVLNPVRFTKYVYVTFAESR